MFNHIGQRFLKEANFFYEDKPYIFKSLITNYNDIASWNDIEHCMNNTQFYDFELIDKQNNKIEIPAYNKAWIFNKSVQEKDFIFDKVNNGYTAIITNYGFKNQTINSLLDTFENIFDIDAAAHLYCGLESSQSFTIHDDYPANFIFQIEGETKWKVFNNKISYLYRTGTMNGMLFEDQLEVAVEVVLQPGDCLYIPARTFHCAYPTDNRISVSIPCWNKLPTSEPTSSIDRNNYNIDIGGKND